MNDDAVDELIAVSLREYAGNGSPPAMDLGHVLKRVRHARRHKRSLVVVGGAVGAALVILPLTFTVDRLFGPSRESSSAEKQNLEEGAAASNADTLGELRTMEQLRRDGIIIKVPQHSAEVSLDDALAIAAAWAPAEINGNTRAGLWTVTVPHFGRSIPLDPDNARKVDTDVRIVDRLMWLVELDFPRLSFGPVAPPPGVDLPDEEFEMGTLVVFVDATTGSPEYSVLL